MESDPLRLRSGTAIPFLHREKRFCRQSLTHFSAPLCSPKGSAANATCDKIHVARFEYRREAKAMKATIERDGRIALQKELQVQLGVQPGDDVVFESCGSDWLIKAAKTETGLSLEGNVLVHRGVCSGPIDASLAQVREERFDQLSEGLPR
jgi:hypothetical protein